MERDERENKVKTKMRDTNDKRGRAIETVKGRDRQRFG